MEKDVIQINVQTCDGCGKCLSACSEGALAMAGGKARLVSEFFCDGLGACITICPTGAISLIRKDVAPDTPKTADLFGKPEAVQKKSIFDATRQAERNMPMPSPSFAERPVMTQPAKAAAEPARVTVESARIAAEPAKVFVEPIRTAAETRKAVAEPAKAVAEAVRTTSETRKVAAPETARPSVVESARKEVEPTAAQTKPAPVAAPITAEPSFQLREPGMPTSKFIRSAMQAAKAAESPALPVKPAALTPRPVKVEPAVDVQPAIIREPIAEPVQLPEVLPAPEPVDLPEAEAVVDAPAELEPLVTESGEPEVPDQPAQALPPAPIERMVAPMEENQAATQTAKTLYSREAKAAVAPQANAAQARWPVQIKLAPETAEQYAGASLLIAADCAAYVRPGFYEEFMDGRVTLIGCPKLSPGGYSEKMSEIIRQNNIHSLTLVRVDATCCRGLERALVEALIAGGRKISWQIVTLGTDGSILED
jgi:ferredoxin